MLVASFPALAAGTNCYVLAVDEGQECIVVDPGIGVEAQLAEVLSQHRVRPAAVLLTHGHLDHVYAVTPVCGAAGVAAYIHHDDRYRLRDPLAGVGAPLLAMLRQEFGARQWREPDDVIDITGGAELEIAGLWVGVTHAPGHTEGSVVFGLDGVPDGGSVGVSFSEDSSSTVLTGDVVFAGSIGRSDLPGGDGRAMQRSLREVVLPLADDTLLLPGHGPATTMRRERATNPFLQGLAP